MQYTMGRTSGRKKEFDLDNNHTHFILVDDGTAQKYNSTEAEFRTKLEHSLSRLGTLVGNCTKNISHTSNVIN